MNADQTAQHPARRSRATLLWHEHACHRQHRRGVAQAAHGRRQALRAHRRAACDVICAAGFEHGRVAMTAGRLLGNHVHETEQWGDTAARRRGSSWRATPTRCARPTPRSSRTARADAVGTTFGFWPGGAPDLAIEVVSPDDSRPYCAREGAELARRRRDRGARAHPRSQSAIVYRAGERIGTFTDGELDLSDAVPGWRVAVADFFAYSACRP